jgi:hypothetical protein
LRERAVLASMASIAADAEAEGDAGLIQPVQA